MKRKLTSIFFGPEERKALAMLSKITGKTQSECVRAAIRDAAESAAKKVWTEEETIERAAMPNRNKNFKGFRG